MAQQSSTQLNSVKDNSLQNKSAETEVKQCLNKNEANENQIKSRIMVLEHELSGSQKKAEQMSDVLENTRSHYSQLENKYDQARKLLKNYQERYNLTNYFDLNRSYLSLIKVKKRKMFFVGISFYKLKQMTSFFT